MRLRHFVPWYAVLVVLAGCGRPEPPGQLLRSALRRDEAPTVSDADASQLAADNARFAFALYRHRPDDGNLVFSPYSATSALAMTYAGARGTTADGMKRALHFTLPDDRLHAACNRLDLALGSSSKGLELELLNQLFLQRGLTFEAPYLDLIATQYGAGLRLLDFATGADSSRRAINDWVLAATHDKIRDLLPAEAVSASTSLVLVNAVYFNGDWQAPFKKEGTRRGSFTRRDGSTKEVDLMQEGLLLPYAADADSIALALPYAGGAFSLLLVVPAAGRFDAFEAKFGADELAAITTKLTPTGILLSLPRFKLETTFPMRAALEAEGMVEAFTSSADFSGMRLARDLQIADVRQKAYLAVDEKGTEAAAASAVTLDRKSASGGMPVKIDRPFLFALRHDATGALLFLGRVVDP